MDARDLTGRTIASKYLLKRRIGAGGMGAVYEGEHVEIGKRVAVKVIEHDHAKSDELAQRFRREARAASAVESEHIVQVFDVGKDETAGLFMVMEMLSGVDLSTRLEEAKGPLAVDEAVTIVLQTARGLAKAHAAGVVHRDLKPANLFLTRREDDSPCVKILDFGISKLVRAESHASTSLTREGVVIGTPQYMSPEQAQGMTVDARTDVWSLGAVAYEILSGVPVFAPRDTYEQMIVQIVTTRPKPLAQAAPHVPAEIASVIDAALVHEVSGRLPDMATFAQRLAEASGRRAPPSSPRAAVPSRPDIGLDATVAATAPKPATSAGVVVQANTAGAPETRRRLGLVLGVGAAVVLLIVGLAVATKKNDATGAPSGIVAATPPPPPVSAPPATKLSPLEPAPAEAPIASAPASASAAPSARATAAKATVRGTASPARPKPAPQGGGQYGAAGVSTAY